MLLVVLKRVSNQSLGCTCVLLKNEEQNIGSPNYISLPSGICSYHSGTRLHQLRQYLDINKRQSMEKLKRKVKVIRLKLLLMSFQ